MSLRGAVIRRIYILQSLIMGYQKGILILKLKKDSPDLDPTWALRHRKSKNNEFQYLFLHCWRLPSSQQISINNDILSFISCSFQALHAEADILANLYLPVCIANLSLVETQRQLFCLWVQGHLLNVATQLIFFLASLFVSFCAPWLTLPLLNPLSWACVKTSHLVLGKRTATLSTLRAQGTFSNIP